MPRNIQPTEKAYAMPDTTQPPAQVRCQAIHAGTATREQRIEHAAFNVQARSLTPWREEEGRPVYHVADITHGPAIKYKAGDLFPPDGCWD